MINYLNKQNGITLVKLLIAIIVVIVIIALIYTLFGHKDNTSFIKTKATITSETYHSASYYSEHDDSYYTYTYVFYVDDNEYTGKFKGNHYKVDDEIKIKYEENNPSNCKVTDKKGFFITLVYIALIGVLVLLLEKGIKRFFSL